MPVVPAAGAREGLGAGGGTKPIASPWGGTAGLGGLARASAVPVARLSAGECASASEEPAAPAHGFM